MQMPSSTPVKGAFIVAILVILLAAPGCSGRSPEDNRVLAAVRNGAITVGNFKDRLMKLPAHYRAIVDKNKKAYLEDLVMERVFYEEAIRKGLDRDREVRDLANEARKKILIAKYVQTEIDDRTSVTDDEIRAVYEARKNEFKTPALYRASHILVATEAEANDLVTQLAGGAKFEDLARERSIDATASRGGDIGYFRPGQLVPEFEKACLKLKVGETGDILHTQFGYHIIRLTDVKEPAVEVYEKVRDRIGAELRAKRRDETLMRVIGELKKKYTVDINEDILKELDKPAAPAKAPAKAGE